MTSAPIISRARRFFSQANAPVEQAWQLSVGADLALPEVSGRRPARVRLINAYLRRLRATAEHDHHVAAAFSAVIGMLEPPRHVLRPAIAVRVARGPRPNSGSVGNTAGPTASLDQDDPWRVVTTRCPKGRSA